MRAPAPIYRPKNIQSTLKRPMLGPTARLVARQSMSPTGSSCENFCETLAIEGERERETNLLLVASTKGGVNERLGSEAARARSPTGLNVAIGRRRVLTFLFPRRETGGSLRPGECLFH